MTGAVPQSDPETIPPPLRRDLILHRGPEIDGQPTWTLQDPLRNRFFRLGWQERLLLNHWQPLEPQALTARVFQDSGVHIDPERIHEMSRFLSGNLLSRPEDPATIQRLLAQKRAKRIGFWKWLLGHYLFFWLPLVRPDRFLKATWPLVQVFHSRRFLWAVVILAVAGLYLTQRNWSVFQATFVQFLSLEGMVWYAATLLLVKIIHELGHAYAAHRHGCRVPSMGVAFMVLWPVLYTDTSEAWKLTRRRARLTIGLAGVGAELIIAALATFVWSFLPAGPAQSSAVLLATVTWVGSLIINLNPCMRFDGYYLLSDLLGMDNLQDRAFALARWQLREWLWGWGEPAPEPFSPRRTRLLLIYAYGTWVYRLLLFLGIALLVYHFAFKIAGILLMAVEILWFIVHPLWRELRQWWRHREKMRFNRNTRVTLLVLFSLLAGSTLPWQGALHAPAVLTPRQHTWLHAPDAARVVRLLVAPNQEVRAGTPLLLLEAPQLERSLAKINARINALRWQIDHASGRSSVLENEPVLQKELVLLLTEKGGIEEKMARLRLTAPFSGRVGHIEKGLRPGRWLTPRTRLLELVDPHAPHVEAYVPEETVHRLRNGVGGRFESNGPEGHPLAVRLTRIDPAASRFLPRPSLAAVHGGPIVTWRDDRGRPVPVTARYRLLFDPLPGTKFDVPRTRPGTVAIPVEKESLLKKFSTLAAAVLIRESGF